MTPKERAVIDDFHSLYYNGPEGEEHIFMRTSWMKVPCCKCPLDLWIYQEIIAEIEPDLIIETGTYLGGSALFMAHVLDIVGKGSIITIDIDEMPRPEHPRIRYVTGSSADAELIESLMRGRPSEKCMVVLDSDHSKIHVLKELDIFAHRVSLGSFMIVEDTNINGHPAFPSFGEGPHEAVREFLKTNKNFAVDDSREKFLMTFNPRGFLKRIS
jgi:cephalosporin hydroxylase